MKFTVEYQNSKIAPFLEAPDNPKMKEGKRTILKDLIKIVKKNKCEINTTYQRSKTWGSENKRKLLDSMLNGYCIGLFVFKESETRKGWEVLDGQQRLDTIFSFIGESRGSIGSEDEVPINGLYYTKDVKKYPILEHRFDGCPVYYLVLPKEMTEQDTAKYFVALQEGTPLNPAERLNAKIGYTRNLLVSAADKMPLLSNSAFMQDYRFSRRFLLFQLFYIELKTDWRANTRPTFVSYRSKDIVSLFDDPNYQDENTVSEPKRAEIQERLNKIRKVTKVLQLATLGKEQDLSTKGYFVSVYALVRYLEQNKTDYRIEDLGKFIIDFRKKVSDADKSDAKSVYTQFKEKISGGTTTEAQETKFDILLNEFNKTVSTTELKFGDKIEKEHKSRGSLSEMSYSRISPETPFDNRMLLISTLSKCSEYIEWFDKYITTENLLELRKILSNIKVRTIRMITAPHHVDEEFRDQVIRLKKQLDDKGIKLEVRIATDMRLLNKIHGRYLQTKGRTFNLPSLSTIKSGATDDIKEVNEAVPFDEWFDKSEDLISGWEEIRKVKKGITEKAKKKAIRDAEELEVK